MPPRRLKLVDPKKTVRRTREDRIAAEFTELRERLKALEQLVTRWMPPEAA
jgi:tetrahydromethanopterin S-methyltransferase subunit B